MSDGLCSSMDRMNERTNEWQSKYRDPCAYAPRINNSQQSILKSLEVGSRFNLTCFSSSLKRTSRLCRTLFWIGSNEQTSRNPRRVAHCRVSYLVMGFRRCFAAKANLLAIANQKTAKWWPQGQGVSSGRDREHWGSHCSGFFLTCLRTPRAVLQFRWNLQLQVPR